MGLRSDPASDASSSSRPEAAEGGGSAPGRDAAHHRVRASWRPLTIVLFAIYGAALVGLVLFKFPFRSQSVGSGRVLNLIPLAGSFSGGVLRYGEIVDNVLVFVPFGIYLGVLAGRWALWRKVLPIVATTVAFETIQYVFAIGRSDITDVLANTLGGLLGIWAHSIAARVLKGRTNGVIAVAALIVTICASFLVAILLIRTLRAG